MLEAVIAVREKHRKWPTMEFHGLEEKWQGLRHGSKRGFEEAETSVQLVNLSSRSEEASRDPGQ